MRISAVTFCLASCCVAFVPQQRKRSQSLRRAATKEVVVVGGGWAGYSAAAALSTSPDVKVTILEASPKASGGLAGGWRTAGGRAVEAGIHGFWREYRNTFDAIEKIGLRVDDVLSDYSPSVLYSRRGKVATGVACHFAPGSHPSLRRSRRRRSSARRRRARRRPRDAPPAGLDRAWTASRTTRRTTVLP